MTPLDDPIINRLAEFHSVAYKALLFEVELLKENAGWNDNEMLTGWLEDAWPHEHHHRLTETQIQIAKKLGISCEVYVQELCRIDCGSNEGSRGGA